MNEMSEEEFIELYKLYLKLYPGRNFVADIELEEKNGKLVSPNPENTEYMRNKFALHVIRTGPVMHDILKLIKYSKLFEFCECSKS